MSQSVQESVSSTTEQSINPIEIALRDFSQHPGRPESYGRLHIRAHCENQSGHLQGCTKTIHHPANQLRCLTLDSRLCGAIFFLLITRGVAGSEASRLMPKGSVTSGQGGSRAQALAVLTPNICTFYTIWTVEALEITVPGTEFSFPYTSHSNLPPQKTMCFSLFLYRGMNPSCKQNQFLLIFLQLWSVYLESSSLRLKMTIKSLFAFNYTHIP